MVLFLIPILLASLGLAQNVVELTEGGSLRGPVGKIPASVPPKRIKTQNRAFRAPADLLNPVGDIPYCDGFDCDDFAAMYCAAQISLDCRQARLYRAPGAGPGHVISVTREKLSDGRYRFRMVEPQLNPVTVFFESISSSGEQWPSLDDFNTSSRAHTREGPKYETMRYYDSTENVTPGDQWFYSKSPGKIFDVCSRFGAIFQGQELPSDMPNCHHIDRECNETNASRTVACKSRVKNIDVCRAYQCVEGDEKNYFWNEVNTWVELELPSCGTVLQKECTHDEGRYHVFHCRSRRFNILPYVCQGGVSVFNFRNHERHTIERSRHIPESSDSPENLPNMKHQ